MQQLTRTLRNTSSDLVMDVTTYKAKLFLVLSALLFSVAFADVEEDLWSILNMNSDFSCPPNDEISPCYCHPFPPIPTVHCSGIRSLKTVSRILQSTFIANPIPYLQIRDCNLMGLPSRAFSTLNITRLQISNSNLTFVAPDAFEGLESLMLLVLHNVMLYDFPTEPLSRLPSLLVLSLVGNKLSRLTQEDLRHISGVKYFGLRGNRLANIERGAFPSGLVTLSLSSNHLHNLNKTVRHMPYLEILYAEDNRLTTIEGELEGLFNLKHLYLANNLLRSLDNSFGGLSSLKTLDLQFNGIYEIGDSLSNLDQLKSLNLSDNILLRVDATSFEGLTLLENLDLSGNHLMTLDLNLSPLVRLISLDLSKNGLYNFSFEEVQNMTNLRILDIEENHLTSLSSPWDSTDLPIMPLQMLFASKNKLENVHEFLRHFPDLKTLDVSWNSLTRLWSADFSTTTRLEYLKIEGNPLACDQHQLHVLHELENGGVEIDGRIDCDLLPTSL